MRLAKLAVTLTSCVANIFLTGLYVLNDIIHSKKHIVSFKMGGSFCSLISTVNQIFLK